jgi:hypothetical protein
MGLEDSFLILDIITLENSKTTIEMVKEFYSTATTK